MIQLILAAFALLSPVAPQETTRAEAVVPAELGRTANVHRSGSLWFAGQFSPDDLSAMREAGIQRVISLRGAGEVPWNEEALVEETAMEFVALPFQRPDELTPEVFDQLRELLADDRPTLLHCGSANRVAGAWIPFRVLDQGVSLEQAVAEADEIGLSNTAYRDLALEYVDRRLPSAARGLKSVKPGINDSYKDPELDIDRWIGILEVESRDVFAARHAVVEALELKPGDRVADVGAGTGVYTFLLADVVGAEGWIHAVDIVPRFLQRIRARAVEREVQNVSTVLCAETSIDLPPRSVDVAFLCDVYHHFEYPTPSLASIHRALVPGGRVVLLDFERIPGVTREWLLDHVRAGKDVFRAEIEAAGFEFTRELEVEGLDENYVLEFRKPL